MKNLSRIVLLLMLIVAVLAACDSGDDDDDNDTADDDDSAGDDDATDDDDDDNNDAAADDDDPADFAYPLVDTGQTDCYDDDGNEITCPSEGGEFYGQDAQFNGFSFDFQDNGDGTVSDMVTGLIWEKTPSSQSFSWEGALSYCESLSLADQDDWRAPSLKELFSISNFETGWPYFDTTYFDLAGSTVSKDEQFWSSNHYVGITVEGHSDAAFGVNHGTGHIKAYAANGTGPVSGNYVRCVRGDSYGVNQFVDNGDGTVTDQATGLMWMQVDSGSGLNWEQALAYAQTQNEANYLGHSDWRLPNVKELQSIVDYTRSPSAVESANVGPAIDPMFTCTGITNEAGDADYPYYWTSTSARFRAGQDFYYGWYVAFGMAVDPDGADFHGAGAVRFDTKVEDGPAGEDGARYYNFVRLVRGGPTGSIPGDDDDDDDTPPPGDDDDDTPPPGDDDDTPPPPQEAIDACEGLEVGDACEFEGMGGETVTGTCQMDEDVLACAPEGGPPAE